MVYLVSYQLLIKTIKFKLLEGKTNIFIEQYSTNNRYVYYRYFQDTLIYNYMEA